MVVATIDISPFANPAAHDDAARARAAADWDRAMSDVGFAVVAGHGVAPEVVGALRSAAHEFFERSAEAKAAYCHGPYGNPLGGYTGIGTEAVSRTRDTHGGDGGRSAGASAAAPPDLVESFIFKPASPAAAPTCLDKPASAYHSELLRVLGCLHQLTAAALSLPADYFERFYSPHAEVSLRLAYYPALSASEQASSAVRYGEHTDYTGFTLLSQDESDLGEEGAGGLQVKLRSGHWHALQPVRGCFVVNIGDLYEVWTNGRWRSTVHRVMKPPAGSASAAAPRLSIPFFTGPHNEAALPTCVDEEHPPLYEPVLAREHLRRKLSASNV
ncbi:hypothetical protein EMIHUDRAFT_463590 [Emiliania huxleyi CCMP1516]|uniref:Fe2OG dioxygenase domain-containing protein n=2 Tax=Emiliania huxleyi TaxID=2903 RepID=A0A0D3JK77_EMIH1|nr:hypothetical protein EMIHUDRAFT_463590 [Emiliania huxleyi CCMP1516]EOD23912.1 hypothetical protein EMIHUDRAFT_463590 [Emiliania huxleyi CCMP1516]|eukprot:XP_005776341.1 hypothetical protein EMIHUDRAFT_463590 [Emiliania huxleyi CCMP1516]